MKFEEMKKLCDEGVRLCKKGLFQDAQIKLYKVFNLSEEYPDIHLETGFHLVPNQACLGHI